MRATTLKKKYAKLWASTEASMKTGMRHDLPYREAIDIMAHNAAFLVCHAVHKTLKKRAEIILMAATMKEIL
jgi:hypothetical protein